MQIVCSILGHLEKLKVFLELVLASYRTAIHWSLFKYLTAQDTHFCQTHSEHNILLSVHDSITPIQVNYTHCLCSYIGCCCIGNICFNSFRLSKIAEIFSKCFLGVRNLSGPSNYHWGWLCGGLNAYGNRVTLRLSSNWEKRSALVTN